MRSGRRIAFDVGSARTGVAISDSSGILATPDKALQDFKSTKQLAKLAEELVQQHEAIEIYIGLPLNLKGKHTPSTDFAISFATELSFITRVPIRFVDERFTTRLAAGALSTAGKNSREQKHLIDSASATVILNAALDEERSTGAQPGLALEELDREN